MEVPCESRAETEICAGENESDFSEDSRKCSGKLRERWKKCLRLRHTIYRGEGVVPRIRLDSTVARFTEDACLLRRSEGDVFLPEFIGFRGNGSSESTCFPEGLVLGNSVKPSHPRNVGLPKFMKQVREAAIGKKVYICERRVEWRVLTSFGCFASFWTKHENDGRTRALCLSFRLVSGCGSLESGNRGSLEPGGRGIRESRTGRSQESRTCEIVRLHPRNSGVTDEGFRNLKEAKSKTLPQKSGFDVWTSGRLVNVYNQPRKS
jgi:hypothetical protein